MFASMIEVQEEDMAPNGRDVMVVLEGRRMTDATPPPFSSPLILDAAIVSE